MRTCEFNYVLPSELISQQPLQDRDQSRMMVVSRNKKTIEHSTISHLSEYLTAGDLLVTNDTKVVPARLFGQKINTKGRVEILLLEELETGIWDVLLRASRRPSEGSHMVFAGGDIKATLLKEGERGRAKVYLKTARPLFDILCEYGLSPVPPYIRRDETDIEQRNVDLDRYQTVFAKEWGAVAAPTAGLHFTHGLLKSLEKKGISQTSLTLHVGLGTFRPITTEQIEQHKMETERYSLSNTSSRSIRVTQQKQNRVVAVGSTTVRTLESIGRQYGKTRPAKGRTNLFVYPPYSFNVVDAMLTNFHLPQSTLLIMVCAFGGKPLMMQAYEEAIKERYRFYSYGDCMLIL
ncbi:MAG: tRNA preQ1(34) S-adenosylmethionine ribosyltransferase-isomerase QueA [Kiritimatiellae bacterium]|nr:tRNA preQ1(34) S-adenosylmethionine ribosyltransferase-isomerase QueA [Kiritimatiellia bacterium]